MCVVFFVNEFLRRCNKSFTIQIVICGVIIHLVMERTKAVSVISDEGVLTGLEPFPLNMSKENARGDHGTIVGNCHHGSDKVSPLQNNTSLESYIIMVRIFSNVLRY